jgi:hypothetical protein
MPDLPHDAGRRQLRPAWAAGVKCCLSDDSRLLFFYAKPPTTAVTGLTVSRERRQPAEPLHSGGYIGPRADDGELNDLLVRLADPHQ